MEGAATGHNRRDVAQREVRQRTNKENWRHRCQNVLDQELAIGRKEQITVMGGDHNAQVGRGVEVEGTRGKYGMNTPTNEAGEDLVN